MFMASNFLANVLIWSLFLFPNLIGLLYFGDLNKGFSLLSSDVLNKGLSFSISFALGIFFSILYN